MATRCNKVLNVARVISRLSRQQKLTVTPTRKFFGQQRWSPWQDLRTTMRDMEQQMENFDRFCRRNISPFRFGLSRSIPVETSSGASNMFRLNIDMADFKPQDVKVTVKDKTLTIFGKYESVAEDGSKVYQEMSREYTLPDSVDPNTLKSSFSSDGILSIEAPIPVNDPTEIPITHEPTDKSNK